MYCGGYAPSGEDEWPRPALSMPEDGDAAGDSATRAVSGACSSGGGVFGGGGGLRVVAGWRTSGEVMGGCAICDARLSFSARPDTRREPGERWIR